MVDEQGPSRQYKDHLLSPRCLAEIWQAVIVALKLLALALTRLQRILGTRDKIFLIPPPNRSKMIAQISI